MRPFTPMAGLLLAVSLSSLTGCDKAMQRLRGGSTAANATSVAPLPDDGTGTPRELTEAEFPALVATPGKLVVAVFHADWCGPCQALKPEIATVAAEFPGVVTVGRFNVDNCHQVAAEKGVRGIPDVRFFRDGKQVGNFTGLIPIDMVRAKFKELSAGITPVVAPPPAPTPEPAPGTPDKPLMIREKKDALPPGMERQHK